MSSFIHLVCASQPLPLSIEKSPRLSYLLIAAKRRENTGETKKSKAKKTHGSNVWKGMEYSITFPAGDVPGSMPTGSLPSFLPQGGSSSLESSALIFNLKCSTKSQTTQTRQSQIDARFTSRNHRLIIHSCNERGPLLRVPHSCNIRSLSGYGSHTGEVVLCWSSFEEARHEHMSDEHKTLWYIK